MDQGQHHCYRTPAFDTRHEETSSVIQRKPTLTNERQPTFPKPGPSTEAGSQKRQSPERIYIFHAQAARGYISLSPTSTINFRFLHFRFTASLSTKTSPRGQASVMYQLSTETSTRSTNLPTLLSATGTLLPVVPGVEIEKPLLFGWIRLRVQ